MKIIIKNIIFISLLISITSCKHKKESIANITEEKTLMPNIKPIDKRTNNNDLLTNELAVNFTKKLKNGQRLAKLMNKNWTLAYHEDNRCTGATDGLKNNLLNTQVDIKITLNVKNNSEHAWACEKKEPYNYDFDFDLKKQVEKWDRFELQNDKKKDVFYIYGAGESDYIKIYFGENKLISKLIYSSEYPG